MLIAARKVAEGLRRDRLHQIAAQLTELGMSAGPGIVNGLMELSRRPALQEERGALIERHRQLERDYDPLSESAKS
jgi:hypothetical protein